MCTMLAIVMEFQLSSCKSSRNYNDAYNVSYCCGISTFQLQIKVVEVVVHSKKKKKGSIEKKGRDGFHLVGICVLFLAAEACIGA